MSKKLIYNIDNSWLARKKREKVWSRGEKKSFNRWGANKKMKKL